MRYRIWSIITFLIAPAAWAGTWDLNDITYIFPLPRSKTLSGAVNAMDLDSRGKPLLEWATISAGFGNQLKPAMALMPGDLILRSDTFDPYADLFVVSARLDPCFRDRFDDICRKQIRLVWQPIDRWREDAPVSADVAIHTFYDLSDAVFLKLTRGLLALKAHYGVETRSKPLQLHPGFSNYHTTAFQRGVRDLLLHSIGSDRLRRIAFMKLAAFSIGWDFFSFDILPHGTIRPVKIFPGTGTEQQLMNEFGIGGMSTANFEDRIAQIKLELTPAWLHGSERKGFRGIIEPDLPATGDQLTEILKDSSLALATSANAEVMFKRATRIENPSLHLPGTIDCASCHIANAAKILAKPNARLAAPRFRNEYNLENRSTFYGSPHQLRMLGYVDNQVQIGDRAIYESAAVADRLNKKD